METRLAGLEKPRYPAPPLPRIDPMPDSPMLAVDFGTSNTAVAILGAQLSLIHI